MGARPPQDEINMTLEESLIRNSDDPDRGHLEYCDQFINTRFEYLAVSCTFDNISSGVVQLRMLVGQSTFNISTQALAHYLAYYLLSNGKIYQLD